MCRFWRNWSQLLAVALCHLLATQVVLGQEAQQPLRIRVIEGDNAKNVVEQITARPIVVRVEDSNGAPVAGARVVFGSPQLGPSGEFNNSLRTLELTTDSDGRASAENYHPNSTMGTYSITVQATFQGQTDVVQIQQENVGQRKGRGKLIAILAVAGGAAAAILAGTLKKNSGGSTPTTPPTITLGGGSVGGPQ